MKHFQNSAKSASLLHDTLAVFSMKKAHLITFCPTHMLHLLDSRLKAVELFIPLWMSLLQLASKKRKLILFLYQ